MRHKVFTIRPVIYPLIFTFCVGPRPTLAEASRYCRMALWNGGGSCPVVGDGAAATINFSSGSFIWLPSGSRHKLHEYFAHELVHVLTNSAKLLCQPMNHETDEMHAYLAGWIAKEFYKHIK